MTNKVCFIILHFGVDPQLTIDAISSIKQIEDGGKADVVVVCNGADCDISAILNQKFPQRISCVVLEQNVGFSKGNNIGYQYAKTHGDYDFILFINNDIIISQTDFIPTLYKIYRETPFYLCGPDVYTPSTDYHSSPMRKNLPSVAEMNQIISTKRKLSTQFEKIFSLSACKSFIIETRRTQWIPSRIMAVWRRFRNNNKPYQNMAENVILQGSCLIISEKFIAHNEKVFEPEVFLYFEEFYLAEKCKTNNWNAVYTNRLQVFHMHRGSSGLSSMNYKTYCKNKVSSIGIYLAAAEQYREHLIH